MNKITVKSRCFLLFDNKDYEWLGSQCASLSEEDVVVNDKNNKFSKNEQISREFFCTANKLIDELGGIEKFASNDTGISFGTSNGCYSSLRLAADNIAVKGVKGMKPKDATNCTMSGAAAKTAIMLGIKGFSITNCDGCNAGIDSVIFSCNALSGERARYVISGAGDEGSAYGAFMLVSADEEKGEFCISGYAKGLLYGDNIKCQIKAFINAAISSSEISPEKIGKFVVVSDGLSNEISEVAKSFCKDAEIYKCDILENYKAASGLMAMEYCMKLLECETETSYAAVVQCSSEGYFSVVILNKQ